MNVVKTAETECLLIVKTILAASVIMSEGLITKAQCPLVLVIKALKIIGGVLAQKSIAGHSIERSPVDRL